MKKLLDFQASISDVKQINPLFSTCKVRVLYTGRNRNMSIISKDAVEKALPTLKNIPIVGEYSEAIDDFKGHGGAIDLDSYKYIHTTKPYGVVPESATYEWEEVKGREYLTINGCYLWTGRYEEAYSVVEKGKGQSMEIEVTDGRWDDEEEVYRIDNFIFSALTILGDDVEPAFEDASITAYSLDRESFKKEFSTMLDELKSSLSQKKEVDSVLKELLKKYSLTVEDLTSKGIKFDEISEDELEAKIIEVFEISDDNQDDNQDNQDDQGSDDNNSDNQDDNQNDNQDDSDDNNDDKDDNDDQDDKDDKELLKSTIDELEKENHSLNEEVKTLKEEVEELRKFKVNAEKSAHEAKVSEMFSNFQLSEDDVKDIDIHSFSLNEIEEKCYAIIGKKLASKNKKKSFSKSSDGVHLVLGNDKNKSDKDTPYDSLFEKFSQ